jgi:hypothetical protein
MDFLSPFSHGPSITPPSPLHPSRSLSHPNPADDAHWYSLDSFSSHFLFDPVSIAVASTTTTTIPTDAFMSTSTPQPTFNDPSSSSLAGAFGGRHQLPTTLPRYPRSRDPAPSAPRMWDQSAVRCSFYTLMDLDIDVRLGSHSIF